MSVRRVTQVVAASVAFTFATSAAPAGLLSKRGPALSKVSSSLAPGVPTPGNGFVVALLHAPGGVTATALAVELVDQVDSKRYVAYGLPAMPSPHGTTLVAFAGSVPPGSYRVAYLADAVGERETWFLDAAYGRFDVAADTTTDLGRLRVANVSGPAALVLRTAELTLDRASLERFAPAFPSSVLAATRLGWTNPLTDKERTALREDQRAIARVAPGSLREDAAGNLWVAGSDGRILRRDVAGSWSIIQLLQREALWLLEPLAADSVIAYGEHRTFVRISGGKVEPFPVSGLPSTKLLRLHCVVGACVALLQTIDGVGAFAIEAGGAAWRMIAAAPAELKEIAAGAYTDLAFGERVVFAFGTEELWVIDPAKGSVTRTPYPYGGRRLLSIDGRLVASAFIGKDRVSDDLGTTWKHYEPLIDKDIIATQFRDRSVGFRARAQFVIEPLTGRRVTSAIELQRTADGGASWTAAVPIPSGTLLVGSHGAPLFVIDERERDRKLIAWHSDDDGQTWTIEDPSRSAVLMGELR